MQYKINAALRHTPVCEALKRCKRLISRMEMRENSCNRSMGGPASGLGDGRGACYRGKRGDQSRASSDKRVGVVDPQYTDRGESGRPWVCWGPWCTLARRRPRSKTCACRRSSSSTCLKCSCVRNNGAGAALVFCLPYVAHQVLIFELIVGSQLVDLESNDSEAVFFSNEYWPEALGCNFTDKCYTIIRLKFDSVKNVLC